MSRAIRPLAAAIVTVIMAVGCASSERPELVPGSTIATSSTTSTEPDRSTTTTSGGASSTDPPVEDSTATPTSIPRLDPDDPNYPTTTPALPQPTVTYATSG